MELAPVVSKPLEDGCTDGCVRGSENKSGLVWHTAEEGLRSCGQPAYHSVSGDFHFGTLCPIREQETDKQRQTDGQKGRQTNKEGRQRRREVLKAKRVEDAINHL